MECGVPFCQSGMMIKGMTSGCPLHNLIPEWNDLVYHGNWRQAYNRLKKTSSFPEFTSRVCPALCEAACTCGLNGQPTSVKENEHAIIEKAYEEGWAAAKPPQIRTGKKIAIIGSGPAGITIAIILARYGYDVTIFEGKDQLGGVLRYGIPEFRLPKSVLDDIKYRHIDMKGIKFRPNTHIGGAIGIDDLFRDGYKAIFVGTGVWKPNSLHIKGETFGNVHFGINYLNNPDSYHLGKRVIVIGAGNAAMDVARTAIRKGVQELTCFSITKKVAASQHEFSYAQLEGVQFEYNKAPVEITDDGVIFKDIIEHEDGTFTDVPDSHHFYPADSVIISISQGPQNRIVNTTKGLTADNRGLLIADETGHTTRPGIFASGDVVNGARTVVEAVAHSKVVAESMHEYMQSLLKETPEAE